jgi:pre-rRNA-processing protein TSR1
MYFALDACKVADYVVLALSSTVEVGHESEVLLRALQAQGLPAVVAVAAPNEAIESKTRQGVLKSLLSFVQYFVPSQTRVFDLQVPSDRLNAMRALCEGRAGEIRGRDGRSWLLGEQAEWRDGNFSVTGIVRGAALSANRLVHLPNHGDFQISKVN